VQRWRLALGAALLVWVLGAAYLRARRYGRDLGLAVLMGGGGILLFATAALGPRPPMTIAAANAMSVASVVLVGGALAVVLWRGFRE